MKIETDNKICFCFDRDLTVSTGFPEGPIPVNIVRKLSESNHDVWATGNQELKEEADIPGKEEMLDSLPNSISVLYKNAGRREMVEMAMLVSEADEYVVIDDVDLSDMEGVTHYFPEEFVEQYNVEK